MALVKVMAVNRGKVKDGSPRKEGNVESRRHKSNGRRVGIPVGAKYFLQNFWLSVVVWSSFCGIYLSNVRVV